MITKENLLAVLKTLGFTQEQNADNTNLYKKHFAETKCEISIDFTNGTINYPKEINTGDNTTTNFSHTENFVVLECVCRLLEKGYKPQDIYLEKEWPLGHTGKSGR